MQGTQGRIRETAAIGLEWIALAVAAVASPILLAGGVSAAARGAFLLLTVAALLVSVFSMIVAGECRILRSFLWAPMLAVLALGGLQLFPAAVRYIPNATPDWLAVDPARSSFAVSLDRGETVGTLAWLSAAAVLVFVLTAHVRTMTRLCAVVGLLAAVLAGAGTAGWLQSAFTAPAFPEAQFPLQPGLAAWLGEIYFSPAHMRDAACVPSDVESAAGTYPFFFSQTPCGSIFGGRGDGVLWTAAVALVFPMVLCVCMHLARTAAVGGFPTRGRSNLAFGLWWGGVGMAAVAAWRFDPLIVPLAATVSCACLVLFVAPDERLRALRWCGGAWVVIVAVVAARFALLGPEDFAARSRAWADDSVAATRIVNDVPWLGCGLGAFRDVWSAYRPNPGADASRVSSAMSFAAEIGVIGALIVGLAFTYGFARAVWVRPRLGDDARTVLAGAFAAAAAAIVLALCDGAMAAAPSLAIGALVLAAAARGAADGFPREAPTPA